MPEIIARLFRDQTIPPELSGILSKLSFSEQALLKASPSKLIPPSSLPGMGDLLENLTAALIAGRGVRVRSAGTGDAVTAEALLARVFKKYRKLLLQEAEGKEAGGDATPLLDLTDPDGLCYRDGIRSTTIPFSMPGGGRYAASGLVFKLGQARRLSLEKGFGRDYVAFDLETSGKTPGSDEIIEIGAVKVLNGRLGDEFSVLIKPARPISKEIENLTGITNEDLKDAPPLEDVLPSFLDFIGDATLVAHNIDFDFAFLNNACRRLLKKRLPNQTYDTLSQARARMPGQSHRLGAVAQALGIELKDWHRATADAKAAALIFLHFMEEDNAPGRYGYFQITVSLACLGSLAAGVPIEGDNAVFFRYGFQNLLPAYAAGEKYFRKHPDKAEEIDKRLSEYLNSWRRKRRGMAVYRVIQLACAQIINHEEHEEHEGHEGY